MIAFEVKDMSCGHCARAITQALNAIDTDAKVLIDMSKHRVHVQPVQASAEELASAIAAAGYTPVAVTGAE